VQGLLVAVLLVCAGVVSCSDLLVFTERLLSMLAFLGKVVIAAGM
jgi:hypothetical protein